MSKTPKKSAKTTTRKVVKKTAVKIKAAKMSAKPVANSKGSRRGFMWKVLEQKQLKQKDLTTAGVASVNPEERVHATATKNGFARFNGPRRRVG